jgi:hypothetical protein
MTALSVAQDNDAIDYDRIYADYLRSLIDTLRGFSPGIVGLDFWVPDEDPVISFRHLLDAACSAGRSDLAVRFGPVSRARFALEDLAAVAAGYGRATVRAGEPDVLVLVEGLSPPAQVPTAHPAAPTARPRAAGAPRSALIPPPARDVYAAALAARQITLEDAGAADPGLALTIAAHADGARLRLTIDPISHVIFTACFAGPTTAESRALLDLFCALITGLPLLEATHHGLLRLEASLRDPAAPPPLPGIILPLAAHPRFALPAALIAGALAAYRAATGYAELRAPYHLAPGPRWQAASATDRRDQIERVLGTVRDADGVTLAAIEHDVRIVLDLPDDVTSAARQTILMRIERALKIAVDPRLEVYAQDRKDRNKLRRLAVITAPTPGEA